MATVAKFDSFMMKAKTLRIEVIDVRDKECQLRISIENKIGEFIIYPQAGIEEPCLSKGQSVDIKCDENIKIKTRVNVG